MNQFLSTVNDATVRRLLAINRSFYRRYAADFTRTRSQAWPGWERLRPLLPGRSRLLDVGCGNGRFGRFWANANPDEALQYHALDASLPLLRAATQTMQGFPRVKTRLEWRDIFADPPRHGRYPLIALLGVLHHIPGHANRAALLRTLAARLSEDGLLIITFWRFGEDARIRGRTLPWSPSFASQIEPNDFLLPWGAGREGALRYCHHFDGAEERALLAESGLSLVQSFAADGASGALNAYRILMRAAS